MGQMRIYNGMLTKLLMQALFLRVKWWSKPSGIKRLAHWWDFFVIGVRWACTADIGDLICKPK
jgi:hypothetical protein